MRRRTFIALGLVALPCVACGSTDPTRSTSNTSATTVPVADVGPTQTRAAEIAQLSGLQTQVAALSVSPTPRTAPVATTVTTATPPATATPTRVPPTVTLAPTATAVPAKVEIVARNITSYKATTGSAYVVGEALNVGQGEADRIQVAASLIDATGQTVGAGSVSDIFFPVALLKPGEKTVWKAYIDKAPAEWKEERVQVQASPASNATRTNFYFDLKVEGATLVLPPRPTASTGVTGQIVNSGTGTATNVAVTAGIYDAADKLLGVADGYAKLEQIPAGGSAPFSVDVFGIQGVPTKFVVYLRARKATP